MTVSWHHSVPRNQCILYCHGVPGREELHSSVRTPKSPRRGGMEEVGKREVGEVWRRRMLACIAKLPEALGTAD